MLSLLYCCCLKKWSLIGIESGGGEDPAGENQLDSAEPPVVTGGGIGVF